MIDYEKTKAWRSDPVRHTYTERDTILYALGVGFAADPLVLEELRFVYEKELQAVPTMAAVLHRLASGCVIARNSASTT